jgi:hypothetical protein
VRFEQTEFCIRVLPCGYCHIQPTNKGAAEIRRRRVLFASERPFVPRCTFRSEMNDPTITARNARPKLMFRPVDQRFLQIVCDLCHSPYIQKTRIFSQNLRGGIAGERAMNFGGAPGLSSRNKAHTTQSNKHREQTNIKRINRLARHQCHHPVALDAQMSDPPCL